uniref:Alpha-carbonic anhydrase domain-containing protein n=1 Tax=Salix viminalis TaxID=40686 RepID=A0A6N2KQY3_SALVM
METKSFQPETHVAQRSRRDKLRSLTSVQHVEDFGNDLDQLAVDPVLTPDLVHVRHVRNGNMLYGPTFLSSAMLSFATSSDVLSAQRGAMVDQELGPAHLTSPIAAENSSFTNMSHPVLSNLNASPSASNGDAQGRGNWTKLGSEQGYGSTVDYAGGSVAGERNQRLMSAVEVLSNNARLTDITYTQYLEPSYNEYRDIDLQSSLVDPSDELSSQDSQKQFRERQFATHPLHQNTLQDVVTSGLVGRSKEIIPHPSTENQSSTLHFDDANAWIRRANENSHRWTGELGLIIEESSQELMTIPNDANTQGLSLSLSSNLSSKVKETQFGEAYESECLQSKKGLSKASYTCPLPRPSILSKGCGKSLHELPEGATSILGNASPLGPFTGYATILSSSRFLKPAQELMDEFCGVKGLGLVRTSELPKRIGGASPPASRDAVNESDTGDKANDDTNLGASPLTSRRSNEEIGHCGGGSSSSESYMPEYQQMKAKLLYLQEEVLRRYKQYHQQMEMVASFFESVAGLGAATQYISMTIKAVSGNFKSIKHAISDQLKHVTKALGENLFSPSPFGSSTAGSLRYKDRSFQKSNSSGSNVGSLEHQEHIWRPQRGLPEPAVVSNWFINARVRLWKPMVEEIHSLETKGLLENNRSSGKNDGNSAEGAGQPDGDHQASKELGTSHVPGIQLECCRSIGSSGGSRDEQDAEEWDQEKRSRVGFQAPLRADRSLMDFVLYQKPASENGGLGAVSLTLGLRHGAENAQRQQLQHMSYDYRNGKKIGDHCGGGGGGTRWEEACFATLYPDLARKIGGDTCRMKEREGEREREREGGREDNTVEEIDIRMGKVAIQLLILIILFIVLAPSIPLTTSQEVEEETEFNYDPNGEKGPAQWGRIHPEWGACSNGSMQSPIDLMSDSVDVLKWEGGAGSIEINGTEYVLLQCHWHSPSEHTIHGKRLPLEAHMVHASLDGEVAVVGIMYMIGGPDSFLTSLTKQLQSVAGANEQDTVVGVVDPRNIKMGSMYYYSYIGSLTTPPCTENVLWAIAGKVSTATREQVRLLRVAVHDESDTNARPTQPINGRAVKILIPQVKDDV